ncbi:MAG: hypothetical protein SW019_19495 [Actinomycetota bacterium]|nr:hypothetical protein [Actinomycetota bacterium]
MSNSAAPDIADLSDAAFGSNPSSWPLPPAADPADLWLRAVAAGGQGHYSSALADLDRLRRIVARGRYASLALSTRASFLRQLGWHDCARPLDGQALAVANGDGESSADALIGLAADALGVGRSAASARALGRAAGLVEAAQVPRLRVRHAWVSAELAMVCGDGGAAVGHAGAAIELAEQLGSVRHLVKSGVVLAAARCCHGDVAGARRSADEALCSAGRHGLVPLRWAAACLLADIGSAEHSPAEIAGIRDRCAGIVTRWGGVWRPR